MHRLAFISDIHSNQEALEAVLSELRADETYCLGDVVGYGASPNEVIATLVKRKVRALLGNHDHAVITGQTSGFNSRAAVAAIWTRNQLNETSAEYIRRLPLEIRFELDGVRSYLTHGSPEDNLWEYVLPATHSDVFDYYLDKFEAEVIALGHTHIPYLWRGRKGLVFNPGSVGQPRNGDRRASFAIMEVRGKDATVEHHLVDYDCEKAASKIRTAGLPEELASRLLFGL